MKNMISMKVLMCGMLLILATSCSKVHDNHLRFTGMVTIRETIIPDTVNVLENIQIKAKAEQTNGCWKDLNFVLRKINNFEYELNAYGTYESYGNCPDVMVYKDTLIDFRPDQTGVYLFRTLQKPNSIKIDTIIVR